MTWDARGTGGFGAPEPQDDMRIMTARSGRPLSEDRFGSKNMCGGGDMCGSEDMYCGEDMYRRRICVAARI